MVNRRNNRNTRKAKLYRFTQRSFQQNCRVTINRILDRTLTLDNEEDFYPDIKEVEQVHINQLEKTESKDTSNNINENPKYSDTYSLITVDEVQEALKGIKRGTAAGPDKCKLSDVKDLTSQELAAIFNKWCGEGIPNAAIMCRTSLLPKTIKDRDQVGNWRPITIGNLLMRIYGRIWDRRLRKQIQLNDTEKGFVMVDGCFENVTILKKIIGNQRKRKKAYQVV